MPICNIDINRIHSGPITEEIGERLRTLLRESVDVPTAIRKQLSQLRELDERFAIVPAAKNSPRALLNA
jgi:hypothetical protein